MPFCRKVRSSTRFTTTDNYCNWEKGPYKGRGRRPNTVQVVDPDLRYAQVHKKRDAKGKIEEVTTRIVMGDEREILLLLEDAKRCKTINTVYVESRNGKFRKDDARLIRRNRCHSKKAVFHDAHIDFVAQVMNYTRTNDSLKVIINPNPALFEQKYRGYVAALSRLCETMQSWAIIYSSDFQ